MIVFSSAYHPLIGGAEIAIEEAIARMSNRYEFYILTHRTRRAMPRHEQYRGATIMRLGFGTKFDRLLLFPFLAAYAGFRIMRTNKRVLLWGVMVSYASIGAFFVKILRPRTSFILTLQEGDSESHLRYGKMGLVGLWWRMMLRAADEVTVISTYLGRYAASQGFCGKPRLIPNGADIKKFTNHESRITNQGNPIVITTSRLVRKNGVDILIRAIAEVKKEIPEIRCHIVGDGEERDRLQELSRGLGLERNVVFFGTVAYRDIPRYLHEADIFARPSRSEGMGSSFVEAMAAGLPVIGTPVGGIPDIIRDRETGILVKENNPRALADAIILLVRDAALRQSLVASGIEMAGEHFSWDSIAEKYADLFAKESAPRIVIATGLYPPDIGGPATYSRMLCDELPRHGIRADVVAFGSVRHLPKIARHVAYFMKVFRASQRADMIFAQDPVSVGLPAALAAITARRPLTMKIVGDYAWEQGVQRFGVTELLDDFAGKKYGWRVEALRRIERWTARRSRVIIVPSEYLKKVILRWGVAEADISVIPNAYEALESRISREAARELLGLSGFILVSAGRLTPWKGFSALAALFPEIKKEIPDARLLIIGSGPEEERLKQEIKNIRCEKDIILAGAVPRSVLLQYLAGADVFVLNTAYEGMSHVLLEAAAAGLPIITTRVGGNPEIIEDKVNGVLIEYNDVRGLRDSITGFYRNADMRHAMGQHARDTAGKFTPDRMMRETAEQLKKAL